jgi:hypothetical protein
MSELADFVLSALRQAGSIVEPPAYGVHEVLLPEQAARRWGVAAYQRLAFAGEPQSGPAQGEDVTSIGYAHPLVETLMEDIRAEPSCAHLYVKDLRLDKRELLELARQTFSFPNARLSSVPRGGQSVALCHYVRFNFKAALITDEKRERLVSVVMDAQAGFAVPELQDIEHLARLVEEPAFKHLSPAPVDWLPEQEVLSKPALEGLLERAARAAVDELAAPLEVLRRRAARHLELDRARLTEYYDDIARDLTRRGEHASDDAHRASLEDKLATSRVEREAKLADVEAKYRLRVELELINLQVISQPKILFPVRIKNRTATAERTATWNPLLHRIEPLACDACGRSAAALVLCSGGHLAHDECLLGEQCVDCKRVYCRLCGDEIDRCVVCNRPVCVSSLNHCDTCRRATCREHVGLCHAADGEPAHLPPPEPAPPVEETEEKPEPPPPPARKKKKPTQITRRPAKKPAGEPAPYKIEVNIEPDMPVVNAFVLAKGKKQFAVRSWELTDEGLLVTCHCEKWHRCPVDGTVLRPADPAGIEAQIEEQIEELRQEYSIAARRVFRYAIVRSEMRQVTRVVLRGKWKE